MNYLKRPNQIITIALYLTLFVVFSNCKNTSREKSVLIDSKTVAVGIMDDSNNYNGLIKFYDQKTNKLLIEANYINGIQNGINREFYANGSIKAATNYYWGKLNGPAILFDSSGQKVQENNFFFDIPAGSIIQYKSGAPSIYDFFSLDNDPLFHLNYDSAKGRKITDLQERFFFYKIYNKAEISENNPDSSTKMDCRLYLVSPPRYQFIYELVIVDDKYKVLHSIESGENNGLQKTFVLGPLQKSKNEYYALRLIINDSINNAQNTMFKILPTPY